MNDRQKSEGSVEERASDAAVELSLQDLLEAESTVLRRVGQLSKESQLGSHFSNTTGHSSSGSHSSHTSAKVERPLVD